MDTQNKWPLYIAIGLPVIFIIGLIGVVYIPQLFAEQPKYDFVYITRNLSEPYGQTYTVEQGKIVKQYLPPPIDYKSSEVKDYRSVLLESIYLYDVETDKSRELTLEEAQALTIDQNPKSPDGYIFTTGQNNGGVVTEMFGGNRNYNSRYLKNGFYSKQIYLTQEGNSRNYYYDYNSNGFIGWVIK